MDKQRDIHLDALKGLAIILVVTGHIIAFSHPGTVDKSLLFNLIYSFHMPLFFFISGYLVFGRFGPTTSGWIQKKFVQLIIPYTIFTFFYFFILFECQLRKSAGALAIGWIDFVINSYIVYAVYQQLEPASYHVSRLGRPLIQRMPSVEHPCSPCLFPLSGYFR